MGATSFVALTVRVRACAYVDVPHTAATPQIRDAGILQIRANEKRVRHMSGQTVLSASRRVFWRAATLPLAASPRSSTLAAAGGHSSSTSRARPPSSRREGERGARPAVSTRRSSALCTAATAPRPAALSAQLTGKPATGCSDLPTAHTWKPMAFSLSVSRMLRPSKMKAGFCIES